jgi:hypothetical protein
MSSRQGLLSSVVGTNKGTNPDEIASEMEIRLGKKRRNGAHPNMFAYIFK